MYVWPTVGIIAAAIAALEGDPLQQVGGAALPPRHGPDITNPGAIAIDLESLSALFGMDLKRSVSTKLAVPSPTRPAFRLGGKSPVAASPYPSLTLIIRSGSWSSKSIISYPLMACPHATPAASTHIPAIKAKTTAVRLQFLTLFMILYCCVSIPHSNIRFCIHEQSGGPDPHKTTGLGNRMTSLPKRKNLFSTRTS